MNTFDKTGHKHLSAERLSEYIDGRLPPRDREDVEAQLSACARCREEADSLRATVLALRRVQAAPAPRSFTLRPSDIERTAPRRGLFSMLGGLRLATAVAAGLLVLVLAGDILRLLPSMSVSPSVSRTQAAPVAALAVPAAPAEPSEPPPSAAPEGPRAAAVAPGPTPPAQKDQAPSLAAAPIAPAATPTVATLAPSATGTPAPAPAPMRAAAAPAGAAPPLSPTPAAVTRAAPAPVSTPTAAAAALASPPTVAAPVETPRPVEKAAPAATATPPAAPEGVAVADTWNTVEIVLAVVVTALLIATLAATWRRRSEG